MVSDETISRIVEELTKTGLEELPKQYLKITDGQNGILKRKEEYQEQLEKYRQVIASPDIEPRQHLAYILRNSTEEAISKIHELSAAGKLQDVLTPSEGGVDWYGFGLAGPAQYSYILQNLATRSDGAKILEAILEHKR